MDTALSFRALDLYNWKNRQRAAEAENMKHGYETCKIQGSQRESFPIEKLSQFKNNKPTYGSFPFLWVLKWVLKGNHKQKSKL